MVARYFVSILFLVALAQSLPVRAAVHYVDVDAAGTNDGTSWPNAFVDLQSALAVAEYGDEVWVAEGVYKPTSGTDRSATFNLVNGVALYGGFVGVETDRSQRDWVLNETLLSGDIGVQGDEVLALWQKLSPDRRINEESLELLRAWSKHTEAVKEGSEIASPSEENSTHVVTAIGVDETCILDGFSVAYGAASASGVPYPWHGGGILIIGSRLRIANTVIRDNLTWGYGGGVAAVEGSHPYFENVTVARNRTNYVGGGVSLEASALTIHGGTFEGNFASIVGGGLYQQSATPATAMTLVDVEFHRNIGDDGCGGLAAREVFVLDSVFDENWTQGDGGGACASGTFINVLFSRNETGYRPDGVGGGLAGGGTLVNVAFVDNSTVGRGGGFAGSGHLTNVTCVGNTSYTGEGGGIYLEGGGLSTLTNTIVWGNESLYTDHEQIFSEDGRAEVSRSLVQGSFGSGPHWHPSMGQDAGNNIDADPRFVDAAAGDLRLQFGSPAVDAGDPSALPPTVLTDISGAPRISGNRIDIGAYEFQFESCPTAQIEIGPSWDGIPLQGILDTTYGPGKINAATDYSGYTCGDPIQAYWLDSNVNAWLVREIATNRNANVFGWHVEDFEAPLIDGIDDGVIFTGPIGEGATASITFPNAQRFGFYLDPNGPGDATNAPQPEHFFTNRIHNDSGADGSGAAHQPFGGDVQCLIYDISHLRGGKPTYVLAWEDLDAGSPVTATYTPSSTDNDFNDLVVEIQAESPVPAVIADLSAERFQLGVRLQWTLTGGEGLIGFDVQRRPSMGGFDTIATLDTHEGRGEWTDTSSLPKGRYEYRIAARFGTGSVYSQAASVEIGTSVPLRNQLVRAVPNPFNPKTRIEYALAEAGRVELRVYDLAGRMVRELEVGQAAMGSNFVEWDGQDDLGRPVASGVYLVRMHAGTSADALRVVLLK